MQHSSSTLNSDQFKLKKISLLILVAFSPSGYSLPQGAEVVSGNVVITNPAQNGLLVNQASQNAQVNWQSFSLGSGERLVITQPNTTAVLLNKVVGLDPSNILGSITANGRVFLLNPNGIVFGRTAQINVGSLVASTMSGAMTQDGRSVKLAQSGLNSSIVNEGRIEANQVALVGPRVENRPAGSVVANGGEIHLISAANVDVDVSGAQLRFSANGELPGASIANEGELLANDGLIDIRVKAADAGNGTVLNVGGLVRANSISSDGGVIRLSGGSNGVVLVSGSLEAKGSSGGEINIRGEKVAVAANSLIDASGAVGGGVVHIGGDLQGRVSDEPNAKYVNIGKDALIRANSTTEGNGGEVVVWADKHVNFVGRIEAKGAGAGASGGFVETSGKESIVIRGTVDTSSPQGTTGTWLIDPQDIFIANGGVATLTDVLTFAANSGMDVTIDADTINAAASNVVLQATRDISVDESVNIAASGVSFTAQAGRDITVNSSITTNNGAILLSANDPGGTPTGTGAISLNASLTGTSITLNNNGSVGGVSGTGSINASQLNVLSTNSDVSLIGQLTVTGATSINAGPNSVVVNNTSNNFNSIGVTGGNVSITDSNAVVLDAISAGNLTLSAGGAVTQNAAATVAGATSVNAGTAAVTLTQSNNFNSIGVTGGNVSITDSDAVALNAISATGNLTLSAGGAVTQNAAATVAGATSVNAGTSAVTLTQANNFNSIGVTGGNVSITDSDAVALNAISATGSLTLSAGGAVTQSAAAIVTGATTINAGTNAVTLTQANNFNSIGVTGGNVSITDSNAVVLDAISAGNLTLSAGGAVTQNAAATVTGATSVNAGTSAVTLTQANNFNSIGVTGGNVSITDSNAVVLDAISAGNLTVSALGNVTQVASKSVVVSGATTVGAGSGNVELTQSMNDFSTVDLAGAAVSLVDKNSVTVTALASGVNQAVSLVAGGVLTLPAATAINTGTASLNLRSNGGTLATTGDLSGKDVTLVGSNGITVGHNLTATGNLDLSTTNAAVTQTAGIATVSGATTVTAGTGAVALDSAGNNFNSIGITGGNVSITDGNAVVLDAISAGNLTVSASGNVTQVASKSVVVSGATTVDAGSGNVELTQSMNDFSTVDLAGAAVSLVDKNSVTVTALASGADQAVSLVAGGVLTLPVATAINTGTASLNLRSNGGTLATTGDLSGKDVTLVGSNGITVGHNLTATGNLDLSTTNAAVTQTAGIATVSGATTVTAGTGAVALDSAGNNFNSIGVTGGNVSITDSNAVVLDAISAGNLTLSSGGAVTQSAAAIVTGATTINAGTAAVTLTQANNFNSIGVTGGNVSITDRNAVVLDAISAGNLTLSAGGAVTQSAAAIVSGATSVNAGTSAVTLTQANNFNSIGVTGGNVSITDRNAVVLDAISAGNLTLSAGGAVTQNAAATVTGATSVNAGTSAVTLTQANNFNSIGVTGGNVSITDSNAVVLDAISVGNLTLIANGDVTQQQGLTVTGMTRIEAEEATINLTNVTNDFGSNGLLDSFQRRVELIASNVSIVDSNSIVLGNVTLASRSVLQNQSLSITANAIPSQIPSSLNSLVGLPGDASYSNGQVEMFSGNLNLSRPVISQASGTSVRTGPSVSAEFLTPRGGSISLTGDNTLLGEVNALSGRAYNAEFSYANASGGSVVAIVNRGQLNVGSRGIEGDLVAIESEGLTTSAGGIVRGRLPLDISRPIASQLPGLLLSMSRIDPITLQPRVGMLSYSFGQSSANVQNPKEGGVLVSVGGLSPGVSNGFLAVRPNSTDVSQFQSQEIYLQGRDQNSSYALLYEGQFDPNQIKVFYNGVRLLTTQDESDTRSLVNPIIREFGKFNSDQNQSLISSAATTDPNLTPISVEVNPRQFVIELPPLERPAKCSPSSRSGQGLSCN